MKLEELTRGTKVLPELKPGTVVLVQNQTGKAPLKWDKSGVILESLGYSQYKVKMDGTGRVTLRNRVNLREIVPFSARKDPEYPLSSRMDRESTSQQDHMASGETSSSDEPESRDSVESGNDHENNDERMIRRSSRQTKQTEFYRP